MGSKNQGAVLWALPISSRVSVQLEAGQRTPVQVWPLLVTRVLAVETRSPGHRRGFEFGSLSQQAS